MPPVVREKADRLIKKFEEILLGICNGDNIPRGLIRPVAPGSVICGVLGKTFYVGYAAHLGLPTIIFTTLQGKGQPNIVSYYNFLRDTIGVDFCVIALEEDWLDSPSQNELLTAVARDVIQRELSLRKEGAQIMNISIFGPNHYPVQDNLVFVLMPFDQELTEIYNTFVKPTVETKGLVCRRADDISSNNSIIQDIWKSICESRFVIADISTLNPNVMYELGIAHAIGKETILINQEGSASKFPFDIAHIRILNYKNNAIGGKNLMAKLDAAITSVVAKLGASDMRAS